MKFCILIQAGLVGLAILSRIHFSKYKDGTGKGLIRFREEIQAIRMVSRREAEMIVRKKVQLMIGMILMVLFVCTGITEVLLWKEQQTQADKRTVDRADYAGEVKKEDIRLSVDDKEYIYTMEIEPREYTEEEFYRLAQTQIAGLETTILGENPDLSHVSSPLYLPEEDADGVFAYTWKSDNPAVLSSYGKVNLEDGTGTTIVILTVEISYRTYAIEHSFPISVVQEMRGKDAIERVEEELRQIEKTTRTDDELELPEQIGDVHISVRDNQRGQAKAWMMLGLLTAILLPITMCTRLKEERKKRNNALIEQYPSFVNHLWLLLGSGMTVQTGIRHMLSDMKEDAVLKRELEYAVHQLDTGSEEAWVYEQLGRRLELPEYYQLLQQLSQHIRMGTKDIRNLMEQELQNSLEKRLEFAKKKGEEASTKLLFPMVVLLLLVMVIIVYPAFVGL